MATKMVHSDQNSPVRQISNQGRDYKSNDAGEFDVDDRDVEGMKRFGLVEKGQAGK